MLKSEASQLQQDQVNAYFQSSSDYWRRIYETRALLPLIYQTRQAAVLAWIAELRLPPSSQILEIGCGAGVLTAELARLGYSIEAVDAAPAMVDLTIQNAIRNGVSGRVKASLADVHVLPFVDIGFDLVIAIGVIPWLHNENRALLEMRRVLKPHGHLIATADNEWRLSRILDPASTPALRPFRKIGKSVLRKAGLSASPQNFQSKRHTPADIKRFFAATGFRELKTKSVGFGPFTMFGRPVFGEDLGIALHLRMQALAERGVAPFHKTGSHYIALAERV